MADGMRFLSSRHRSVMPPFREWNTRHGSRLDTAKFREGNVSTAASEALSHGLYTTTGWAQADGRRACKSVRFRLPCTVPGLFVSRLLQFPNPVYFAGNGSHEFEHTSELAIENVNGLRRRQRTQGVESQRARREGREELGLCARRVVWTSTGA
ncbi:hypothetical protein ARMGADRAFT_1013024 [Armillaria gallica]|uniref:Uncharacterized protein n=1 Tax=Armillaria gallica TaxID=47427 RepID=A0A2H3DLN5_ARMGA|nr:hypothetical protein ARMGADRAFT_1013024 [Armillaria gallica]